MGTYVIRVPDIGEGIAEVELVAWHVAPGDLVAEEQRLADVMTDKANVEIPSPVAGKVIAVTGRPGEMIAVGAELLRLDVAGAGNLAEDVAGIAHPPAVAADGPAKTQPPVEAPSPPANAPLASPAVRRRARELGIDLRSVRGTGPDGRITQQDLDAQGARGAGSHGGTQLVERHGEETVAVIGLRRRIAEKMQESKRRIAHFTYVEEIDVTELEALRMQLNVRWASTRGRLTLLPFLMRAIARAAPDFPEINARYDDDAGTLTRYGAVHLGIATQTERGLMVPVVRHAEARDLWSCAAEVARLAEAARSGKALRDELSGSTLTITSLGPLGGIVTTPVINRPEVAIVGVNRVVERPVIRSGAVVPRLIMNLSSSFDHRVVDGMRGAQFVQALRGYLEAPATLFID